MNANLPENDRLRSPDADERARGVEDLLGRISRADNALEVLAAAVAVLDGARDREAALPVTEAAIRLAATDRDLAEWLKRRSWCLFYLDRREEAADTLARARALAEKVADPGITVETYVLSGYLMDVQGAHPEALAWYARALSIAPPGKKAPVLLEMGTSSSKQGNLAEALRWFEEGLASVTGGDAQPDALRVHLLSRSAVVLEQIGSYAEALRRAGDALDGARSLKDPELEFACLGRRARTLIALRDYDAAVRDLADADALAPHVRRGAIQARHDWARYHRARHEWDEAIESYRTCIRLLPDAEAIVSTFADLWTEILDGLDECARQVEVRWQSAVRRARDDMRALRENRGIYGGQPVALNERSASAVWSTEEARQRLLQDNPGFFAAGFHFDLASGLAIRPGDSAMPIQLTDGERAFLACLFSAPRHTADMDAIATYIASATRSVRSHEAIRSLVSELKKRLGVGNRDLVVGRRGRRGGGYVLRLE